MEGLDPLDAGAADATHSVVAACAEACDDVASAARDVADETNSVAAAAKTAEERKRPMAIAKMQETNKRLKAFSEVKDRLPEEPNIFSDTPDDEQADCNTCEQKTGTVDRQSNPKKLRWLKWHKKDWVRTRCKKKWYLKPKCKECYPCLRGRRKVSSKPQVEFNTEREENTSLDEMFWKVRADIANEGGAFKGQGHVEVKHTSQQRKPVRTTTNSFQVHAIQFENSPGIAA